MTSWRVLEGDCRDVLATLEAGSVQTCVTSPPYFGLRDYGHGGQIGLEPTTDEFVAALIEVFREVRRVLRDDGTVWLNLGDSYAGASAGLKPKDLIGIPWMVAFALRADGWYLRSDIVWAKPNPMPESVTDRPTKAHEYLFLLSKGPRYFYDAEAIREPLAENTLRPSSMTRAVVPASADPLARTSKGADGSKQMSADEARGANKRTVWTVATQPYAGAHFATFPPKLIEPCVLAGCPEKACAECGAPWRRVVERTAMVVRPTEKRENWQAADDHARTQVGGTMLEPPTSRTVGFEPSCDCDAGVTAGVVLDPFAGAGTTGMVALRHGRSFVGVELNGEYARMARHRIVDDAPLLNSFSEAA